MTSIGYKNAGVDIDFAASLIAKLHKTKARDAEVIDSPNDFAGLFSLKELKNKFDDPVLVSSTDGVGTKLLVAIMCESYDGLGQDLVAMCANDIATKGAEPLFFLDYFATAELKHVPFSRVVNAMATACDQINCALIGGETAEMPSLYGPKHFDLAGFIVGIVERSKILGAHRVKKGDRLIGITSSGLHANGFSLVRKIMFEKRKLKANDVLWQTSTSVVTVADELLKPTKLYGPTIEHLAKQVNIHAAAHITGGGLLENIPRIIPKHLMARLDLSLFVSPPIFDFLKREGAIDQDEMDRTFNMGLGMVLVIDPRDEEICLQLLKAIGEQALSIGQIEEAEGEKRCHIIR